MFHLRLVWAWPRDRVSRRIGNFSPSLSSWTTIKSDCYTINQRVQKLYWPFCYINIWIRIGLNLSLSLTSHTADTLCSDVECAIIVLTHKNREWIGSLFSILWIISVRMCIKKNDQCGPFAMNHWNVCTWFRKVMDIHIYGMFSNLSRRNRRDRLDEIRHIEPLAHLPMLWQQRNVVDLDHFDDESVRRGTNKIQLISD